MSLTNELPIVVIVDDEPEICASIKRCLMRVNAQIHSFTSPRQALNFIKEHTIALIISDQRMPDIDGHDLLKQVRKLAPQSTRIMLSAYQDFDDVSKSFNEGIIDKFISKPWKNVDLVFAVENAINAEHSVESKVTSSKPVAGDIIGESTVMQTLKQQIKMAAGANVPIFVHGETGTGKELVANACHKASSRVQHPFIAVNCANFSEQLIDAQLFGAVKGAYTGAVKDSQGIFAQADGGTVFLDEITTLPIGIQAKLLRVLQEREYTPLGSTVSVSFDTQIVSASSVKLSDAVNAGEFREDLFYRLNVIPLSIAPLRERGEDIAILANYFLSKFSKEQGKQFTDFSSSTTSFMKQYHWPGNVRQLENTIHGACIMHDGTEMTREMIENILQQHVGFNQVESNSSTFKEDDDENVVPLADVERKAIESAIAKCNGNVSQVAALLQVNPSTIYRKMQKW